MDLVLRRVTYFHPCPRYPRDVGGIWLDFDCRDREWFCDRAQVWSCPRCHERLAPIPEIATEPTP